MLRRMRPLFPGIDASSDRVLGVEATRAIGEREPTVLVHVASVPERPSF